MFSISRILQKKIIKLSEFYYQAVIFVQFALQKQNKEVGAVLLSPAIIYTCVSNIHAFYIISSLWHM